MEYGLVSDLGFEKIIDRNDTWIEICVLTFKIWIDSQIDRY